MGIKTLPVDSISSGEQFLFRSLVNVERCEMHENHVQHQFLDFNMPKDFFERQTTAGWIIWQQSALQSPFLVGRLMDTKAEQSQRQTIKAGSPVPLQL